MASLKEIKNRLASITNTQKITSAMKMVSSAKLHHMQTIIGHLIEYENKLSAILNGTLSAEYDLTSPYTAVREVKSVAIIAFSSNTGLCGVYNANVWKELAPILQKYENDGVTAHIYPVGKKIANELRKAGYKTDNTFLMMGDNPNFEEATKLATLMMDSYILGKVDKVELLYHHFKSMGKQILTDTTYLPITLPNVDSTKELQNYILEPSADQLLELLMPKVLHLQIYTTLIDTITAEHAARMLAMQTANDNANDLIQQLTLQYNKTRQQSITNELLDIVSGSER